MYGRIVKDEVAPGATPSSRACAVLVAKGRNFSRPSEVTQLQGIVWLTLLLRIGTPKVTLPPGEVAMRILPTFSQLVKYLGDSSYSGVREGLFRTAPSLCCVGKILPAHYSVLCLAVLGMSGCLSG